ncbi:ribonucleotide reductase inhibitor-domain-containing protein [Nemania serpens]|nr:ribonucleotide reductase inhibitor-domain-containing protein [Nemania serpens]
MSAPRTKRQFAGAASDPAQRQITSFFTSAAPNHSYNISQTSSFTPQSPDSPLTQPNIPASVQANLLSVGMRIRKSVPEGYKTGGDYNAFALWDESDTTPATGIMGEGQRSRANAFSSPRELLPFCGIHKVGGLDTQPEVWRPLQQQQSTRGGMYSGAAPTTTPPIHHPSFGVDEDASDDDEMPGLTSSQESVESNASSVTTIPPGTATTITPSGARSRKRYFVEDDEDGFAGQFTLWRHDYNNNNTLAPVAGRNDNGRAMAVPSTRRLRTKFSGANMAMSSAGQENRMVVDGDFGEAEFLDQGVWEVDMDDV